MTMTEPSVERERTSGLKGKNVLVTGGTSGIGQAVAVRVAAHGATRAITSRLIPKPSYLGYSVSKGGMQNLTRSLALEYAGRGIRVNGIGPGATITPINRAWVDDPVKSRMVTDHIPMLRAGSADEMGGVVCFLASDDAAYITGQTIFVDGGLTLFADFREPWSSE